MSEEFSFCPICQLPLHAISISADAHVTQCMTRVQDYENNEECILGVHCLSMDVFHYRDFSHKLLAEYRSSADFVPPEVTPQPSPRKNKSPSKTPKRQSPRKRKTPSSSNEKEGTNEENESDEDILSDRKKPKRILNFDSNKSLNKNSKSKTRQSNKMNNNTDESLSNYKSRIKKNQESVVTLKPKMRKDKILDQDEIFISNNSSSSSSSFVKSKTNIHESTVNEKQNNSSEDKLVTNSNSSSSLTVVNVKLNSGEEVSFSNTRPPSPTSSFSISSTAGTATSKTYDSEFEFETMSESSNSHLSLRSENDSSARKIVLKEATLKVAEKESEVVLSNDKTVNETCEGENILKDITRLPAVSVNGDLSQEISGYQSVFSQFLENVDDTLAVADCEKAPSVVLSTHTASDGTFASPHTSDAEDDYIEMKSMKSSKSSVTDCPSSPEVIIPVRSRKQPLILSSSSDSDIPLAVLSRKLTLQNQKRETTTRNSTPKGKIKAGKVLRTPKKSPVYLNGFHLKTQSSTQLSTDSEKDSDSGKSSGMRTVSSFVPSDGSTTVHSDSAFSAESTENLTSSSMSTYSSSELSSLDNQTDLSFSEGSVAATSRRKSSYSSPGKNKTNKYSENKKNTRTLSSDNESSASEISKKEWILFGGKTHSYLSTKKTKSPKKVNHYSKKRSADTTDSDATVADVKGLRTLVSKMRQESFPSDLKIDSEDSLTIASSCSSSDTSRASASLPLRQCPFYKRIPDTPFAVDAFQYWNIPGVKVYFLSHFHSDHYIGLRKSFSQPIYCTKITANLVHMKLRVDRQWLRIIELNTPQIIQGVEVTALDANHCPGSVMFLFSLRNGQNHLHVGDFRACHSMTLEPSLRRLTISKLFLDTTYCSAQYRFPTQEEVIGRVVDIVKEQVKKHPRTLVVCGSYTIGKEKVFLGVAEALDWKVWARPEKQRVFSCLEDERISQRLVRDPRSANVHVLPMASIQIMPLNQHMQTCAGAFTHVIGVKPTGWELNANSDNFKVTTRDNITIYGVAYSEHSSFTELRDFVQFVQPREIIPTVNVGSAANRTKMNKYFAEWQNGKPDSQTSQQTKLSHFFPKLAEKS